MSYDPIGAVEFHIKPMMSLLRSIGQELSLLVFFHTKHSNGERKHPTND